MESLVREHRGNTFSLISANRNFRARPPFVLHFHLVFRSQPFKFLNSLDKFVSYSIGRKVAGEPNETFATIGRVYRESINCYLERNERPIKLQNNFLTLNIPPTKYSTFTSELLMFKRGNVGKFPS